MSRVRKALSTNEQANGKFRRTNKFCLAESRKAGLCETKLKKEFNIVMNWEFLGFLLCYLGFIPAVIASAALISKIEDGTTHLSHNALIVLVTSIAVTLPVGLILIMSFDTIKPV